MSDTVTELPKRELTIREQAQQEVLREQADKAKQAMKKLLKDKLAAEAVVKGIDLQLTDLEQQIADGTV